jgi:hypothetical protein
MPRAAMKPFLSTWLVRRMNLIDSIVRLPWGLVVMACLTLGLAPFTPPHIVEKIGMLMAGKLVKPIDWFDLVLHGAPWALLLLKAALSLTRGAAASS